jgi:hypothetical protein
MYGRVYGELLNVPRLLRPEVQLQINFTKPKSDYYAMITKADSGAIFKFLESPLHVRQVKPLPTIQLARPKLYKR